MKLDIKILDPRLRDWGLPQYHSDEAAGIDLRACLDEPLDLEPQAHAVLIKSGIAVAMPQPDMAAILASRSGLGHRGLTVSQGIGTIDADYHAEILISAWNRNPHGSIRIDPGDRIAQLVFVPVLRLDVTVVEDFARKTGRGGFGSTGV